MYWLNQLLNWLRKKPTQAQPSAEEARIEELASIAAKESQLESRFPDSILDLNAVNAQSPIKNCGLYIECSVEEGFALSAPIQEFRLAEIIRDRSIAIIENLTEREVILLGLKNELLTWKEWLERDAKANNRSPEHFCTRYHSINVQDSTSKVEGNILVCDQSGPYKHYFYASLLSLPINQFDLIFTKEFPKINQKMQQKIHDRLDRSKTFQ